MDVIRYRSALFNAWLIGMMVMIAACEPEQPSTRHCKDLIYTAPVVVPSGTLVLGAGAKYPEERRTGSVPIKTFALDRTEVSNAEFQAFVSATGYVSIAERSPDPNLHTEIDRKSLVPGSAVFASPTSNQGQIWKFVEGAYWAAPKGPSSDLTNLSNHPVVHIAYADAVAYAQWKGGRLPSEDEWEYAARGGMLGATYEWGEKAPADLEEPAANTWQGVFPIIDVADDGFEGTSPVGCYAANGYGLYDMTGNVWEWVSAKSGHPNLGVIKGGSHLCSENFCRRFRPAARQPHERDFSTTHIGFRVAYDLPIETH